jgi:hypothetical protein
MQFAKYTRVKCSTSNLTCTDAYCRIKPINRYLNYLNMGCSLAKPVRNIIVTFSIYHRHLLGGRFNHMFTFKNLSACEVTKLCINIPMFKPLVDYANATLLQGIIKECPYGPGFIRIVNASIGANAARNLRSTQRFPNGDYKIDAKVFNGKDENIFTLSLVLTNSWRQNTLDTNEKF